MAARKSKTTSRTISSSFRGKFKIGSALLFAVLLAAVTWLAIDRHQLAERLEVAEVDISNLQGIDYSEQQRPVVLPKENKVAIPELRLMLPYNEITKHLTYYHDSNDYVRVYSTKVVDNETRQLSCLELVRLTTDSATPNSPWEEYSGSVKLTDGRTMYVFGGKAFANHEASTLDCAREVWTEVTPQQVAEIFIKAEAY